MVSTNVAQLLQSATGAVREMDFSQRLPDPSEDVRIVGPVRGRARLTRTSRGILVHADHAVPAILACARCLGEVRTTLHGAFDEEFLPTTDVRTGRPLPLVQKDATSECSFIDGHHEIKLDETLRQDILTSVPLRVLCDTACPGLCLECGRRLDERHGPHAGWEDAAPIAESESPFARLAQLLGNEQAASLETG